MSDKNKGVSHRMEKAYYSEELKQRLVVAANQPGASLSMLAQRWGVSASALSKWCRQYQQPAAPATLIPIAVQPEEASSAAIEATGNGLSPRTDSFVFRGRRGNLLKVLWVTNDGLCLLYKRLERGFFVRPVAREGKVFLTQVQLAMLLEDLE